MKSDLSRLEEILSPFQNSSDFLKDHIAINRYFLECAKYFGSNKFPESNFRAILSQLERLRTRIPSIDTRLWSNESLGEEFSIEANICSFGRDVESGAWQEYFLNWSRSLEENQVWRYFSDEQKTDWLKTNLKSVDSVKKREEVVSLVLWNHINSHRTQNIFSSRSADLIIDEIRTIRQLPKKLFLKYIEVVPPTLAGFIRNKTPRVSTLISRKDIFPQQTCVTHKGKVLPSGKAKNVRYNFVPIPRRIHGLWKGIPMRECVGGNWYDPQSITPNRWATILINESKLFHVESEGHFYGFIHIVPIHCRGRIYQSIEFQSSILKRIVYDDPSDRGRPQYLFEHVLKKLKEQQPLGWNGFVMGRGLELNDAACLETVLNSYVYRAGQIVGTADEVREFDLIENEIPRSIEHLGLAEKYSKSMVYEARLPDTKELVELWI